MRPGLLREELLAKKPRKIIIDEVQKVPALLDEAHKLIEDHGFIFGLCGSSARKLKRGHGNLLGGRAISYEMRSLVYPEIKKDFDLSRILNRGLIPQHYLSPIYRKYFQSYVNEYLKEEIAAEGFIRNLPVFSDFLRATALADTETVHYTNIASDCGVSSVTVKGHYQILVDTLMGSFLPAYTRRAKRKVIHSPKFYYFDLCIPNLLAKRKQIELGSELAGKAFENFIYNEIKSYVAYRSNETELSYWKLADSGREVDLIINDFEAAIEIKASSKVRTDSLRGLHELSVEHPTVKKKLVVSLEKKARKGEGGILILPCEEFLQGLWAGEWF
jgi:predicted AAA+ superfamily ATPase